MNYRHGYHAGNFADCFKHALLVALVDSLTRKTAPFFVLDTHAGAGRYDLGSEAALRTSEADGGIRRLLQNPAPALARYLGLVEHLGLYPGSPALIQALLRADDRLACCELQTDDLGVLRHGFHGECRVHIHGRSGWEAVGALLPPPEKRGLVFIDPPYEAKAEFSILSDALQRGHVRFRNGIFAAWYPIKSMSPVRELHRSLASAGIPDISAVEIYLREATNPERLNGCGLVVINPPYQFDEQARAISRAVLTAVAGEEPRAGMAMIRLADE